MVIELKDVCKTYLGKGHNTEALKNINLTIEKGEFVAIMGASGSGKSTLLNILGCIDSLSNGSYNFNNKDVETLHNKELAHLRNKEIGYIFQSFNLIEELNIIENVSMPLGYGGVKTKERHKIALKLLEQVGLLEKEKVYPRHLSGGQQQRVAIARALSNNPDVLLADEPTGNLDSKSGAEIMDILMDLHKKNTTIILVTHDEKVAAYAKRRIVLKDGKIILDQAQ